MIKIKTYQKYILFNNYLIILSTWFGRTNFVFQSQWASPRTTTSSRRRCTPWNGSTWTPPGPPALLSCLKAFGAQASQEPTSGNLLLTLLSRSRWPGPTMAAVTKSASSRWWRLLRGKKTVYGSWRSRSHSNLGGQTESERRKRPWWGISASASASVLDS